MKRRVKVGLCVLVMALAIALLAAVGLYRHFAAEEPTELDGAHTYADNEKLLGMIAGDWLSEDECFQLSIQADGTITIFRAGETVLEDTLQFCYLQPGDVPVTEFDLSTWALITKDGEALGTVEALRYENAGNGSIVMKLEDTNGKIETIVFRKNEI